MFTPVFIAYLTQGLLLGLVVLALLAAAPKLQKRYGPQWLCRLWVTLAVLLLVPVRALLPQAPAAVTVSAAPLYTPMTALSEETDTKPAVGVPYRTTTAADNTTHYIVPRAGLQTGQRTVLEHLAVDTNWGNLAALAWEIGIAAVLLYQFGGYAFWRLRIRRTAQPLAQSWRDALPQGECPHMMATSLVRSPMVAGIMHPVLLVPPGEAPQGADCMLAHELTHMKRRDVAKKLLLTLACAAHWYNPAVWMLAARAGRDIEAACDAETLRGRDTAYRAAYADALMAAVRRSRSPALTSSFALNKRQLKQRLAALWDTAPKRRGRMLLVILALIACCAGSLVACQLADTSAQDMPETTPTATPSTEEALAKIKEINRKLPNEQELNAITRATDYYSMVLTSDHRLASQGRMMVNGVDPQQYDKEELVPILDGKRADGTTWRDYLEEGYGMLVKVDFQVEYQPEVNYTGPQYSDGQHYVYLIVPYDETDGVKELSGWLGTDDGNREILPEASALKLTNIQYRMLMHQCAALATAGVTDFTTPADWTLQQVYTYDRIRSLVSGNAELGSDARMNLDFSDTMDWDAPSPYLTELANMPPEEGSRYLQEVGKHTLPGYEGHSVTSMEGWTLTREGDTITAEWPGAARYTFRVYNGDPNLKFDARTIIVGGEALQ